MYCALMFSKNEECYEYLQSKKIYDFIPGEKWGEMREDRKYLQRNYPEIILQEQLINLNNGVTIILLKK